MFESLKWYLIHSKLTSQWNRKKDSNIFNKFTILINKLFNKLFEIFSLIFYLTQNKIRRLDNCLPIVYDALTELWSSSIERSKVTILPVFIITLTHKKEIEINNVYYCRRSGHIIISFGVEIYNSVDSNRRVILVIILSVIVFCVCLCHYHWHIEVKCRVAYCLPLQY